MARAELSNVVGSRGEQVFYLAVTDYREFPAPLFEPSFLGEKCPDVDFLVRLRRARGVFFTQVRTTNEPLTATAIRVRLTAQSRLRLSELPGPTYLVGVHEPSRRCFIRSVDQSTRRGITSIPLTHELVPANLGRLYREVKEFWAAGLYKPQQSVFS